MRLRPVLALLPALCLGACRGPASGPEALPPGVAESGAGESGASMEHGAAAQEPLVPGEAPAGAPEARGGAGTSPEGTGGSGGTGGTGTDGPWLRGQLSTRYRGRWKGGEDDHDLVTTLSAEGGDPASDRWTFYFLGSLFADLDGHEDPNESLFGLDDTWDHAVQGRIYRAYADRNGDTLERLRLGRQLDYDTPALAWFDGLSLATAAGGEHQLAGGLYGGIPVHAYESSPSGDLMAGAWAEARPWRQGRLRLDYMHIEDEFLAVDREDDLAAVSLWQGLGRGLRLEGGYSMLDGDDRDVRAAGTLMSPDGNVVVRASYYQLLETQRQQTIETDPLYNSLQELFPYEQVRLMVSGNVSQALILEGGVDLRRVRDEGDVGQFNRDFDRTFVTANLIEGLPWGLEAAVTWDAYDSDGIDTRTLGGDLTRAMGERTEASLGTYYSLYKYDLLMNEERDDLRTWYLRLRRRLDQRVRLDVGYEYENDDLDDYHTLRVGATWRF